MSDASTVSPEEFAGWLRPSEAVSLLTAGGWDRDVAIAALIGRLNAEIIRAAAEHVVWRPVGGPAEKSDLRIIPGKHWNADSEWLPDASLWRTGDIYFDITGDAYEMRIQGRICYFGIRLGPEQVMKMAGGLHAAETASDQPVASPDSLSRTPVGRPLSDRWRPWIAELVAYVHENGIPEGVGSQGQEELIAAVADRLANRGEEALGRSTVQAVVQEVLDRLRSAEN